MTRHNASPDPRPDAEARFRATFERSAVGMAQVGIDGSWLRVNQRLCDMLGYGREELMGLRFADITHPDDIEDSTAHLRGMLAGTEGDLEVEKRYLRKDGSVIWVNLSVALVDEDDGQSRYFVSVLQDITEQKHAQRARALSEDKFSTAFHTSPDAVNINRLSDGLYLALNEGFTDLSGYTPEDALGKTSADISIWDDPEDRDRLVAGLLADGGVSNLEAQFRCKDGSVSTGLMSARVIVIEGEPCILSVTRDISERKAAEERIRMLNRVYAILSGINQAIVRIHEPQDLFEEACRIIVEDGGLRGVWMGLVEPDGAHVLPAASAGVAQAYLDALDIVLGDEARGRGPVGRSISTQRHVTCQDVERDPSMEPWREMALRYGYRSAASFPLIVGDRAIGAICMYANELGFFDDEQLALLDELAADVSFAMEFAQAEERRGQAEEELERRGARLEELLEEREHNLELLASSLSSIIQVMSELVEIRDPYTAGHQRRVSQLAVQISREMGMPAHQVEDIRVAALIHDVGKMSVPSEILSKPGTLTSAEFALIHGHAEAGYRIITAANMAGPVAEIIYQHHERCDGSGYPRGLSATDLLPSAKVLMVADVVEAMTSHRPYRPALGTDAALAEIERGAGSLYDADVCRACRTVFHDAGFTFAGTEAW